jgi:hypothetical protein
MLGSLSLTDLISVFLLCILTCTFYVTLRHNRNVYLFFLFFFGSSEAWGPVRAPYCRKNYDYRNYYNCRVWVGRILNAVRAFPPANLGTKMR